LQRLIASGANLDAKDKNGKDAFIYALENKNIDALKLICESQPKLIDQLSEDYKKQALTLALRDKSGEILKYLKSIIETSYKEFILSIDKLSGNNMLMIVAQSENSKVFSIILDDFPKDNIDNQNHAGETALMHAVNNHRQENIDILLANGADINKPDNKGNTPALKIIKNLNSPLFVNKSPYNSEKNITKSIEILKLLLKANANLNLQDEDNKTLIMIACSCQFLLEGYVAKDNFWANVPASKNYINFYFNIIDTILEHNPNLDITNNNNKTCLTIFLENLSQRIEEVSQRTVVINPNENRTVICDTRIYNDDDEDYYYDDYYKEDNIKEFNLTELKIIKTATKPVLEKMLQLKKEALTTEESDLLNNLNI
jgi:serine/threonine-protein phosphatase 6 regulatory ankyrin repeat subunit A